VSDDDERINEAMATIISSLLDVVKLQHEVNDRLARQHEELIERVDRIERKLRPRG
jgi:hypothetical protein